MLKIILLVIGSNLLLVGCESSKKSAESQYIPEYKTDTISFSVQENTTLKKWWEENPELITKIKSHSDANAAIIKSHNEFARAHNKEALKKGNVPEFIIKRAYPESNSQGEK